MTGGEIKVVMTLDDRDFTVKTVKAGETLRQVTGNVNRAHAATKNFEGGLMSMGTKFKDLVFAISILRFALHDFADIVLALPTAFIKAGGEMERMMALMEGLSKETDKLKRQAEAISNTTFVFGFAQNAPFELKTVTDLFVKLKTAGIDPTNGSLAALTNSLAKFGATDEQAKRAGVAISQMAGKGVVSMEELRQQLGEAVPNAMQMMARGMGLSMAELAEKVSKGTVEASTAINKMLIQMEIDAAGAATRMKNTLPGLINQFATEWELLKIEAAGGGAGEVVKEQLRELVAFMKSPDGKKFAQDIGVGLKAAVNGVVGLKDAIVELWPVIKLAGIGMLYYFGGNQLKSAIDNVRSAIQAKKAALEEMRQAQIAGHQEEIRQAQGAIQRNNIEIAAKAQALDQTLALERSAHLEKIKLAGAELKQVQTVAQAKRQEAARTTQQAGQLYAEAIKYERMIDAIDQSGKSRQGRKRDVFVENMNAYREETIALQQKAVGLRNEAKAAEDAAVKKLEALKADRSYVAQADQTIRSLQLQQSHLQSNNRALQDIIATKERLISKASGAGAAIMSFGKSLLSMVGWGLAVQGAMMLVVGIYDAIAGSAKRAAAEIDRLQRIKDRESNRADMDSQQAVVNELNNQIDARQRQLAAIGGGNSADQVARRRVITDEIRLLENKLRVASQNLEQAKDTVDRTESVLNADSMLAKVSAVTEDRVAATEVFARLTDLNKRLAEAEKGTNTKLFEDLKQQQREQTIAYLREKSEIAARVYEEELPRAQAKGERTLRAFNAQYAKLQQDISAQITAANDPNRYLNSKKTVADPLAIAQSKESALFKLVENQRADFAKAKVGLDALASDADELVNSAKNKALFELLGKLSAGEFDINATSKIKGSEPGKAQGRDKWMEQFLAQLAAGKGGADDFLASLQGLDIKLKDNETTVRKLFQTYIDNAGAQAQAERDAKALSFTMQRQTAISEELKIAQQEYMAGINFMPQSLVTLQREFAKTAEKMNLTGEALEAFNKKRREALADQLEIELIRSTVEWRRKAEEVRINSIVNERARETAQHELRLRQLQEEFNVQKRLLDEAGLDQEVYARKLRLLTEDLANKRIAEDERYFQANKTGLDRLVESWKDVSGNIDKVVESSASRWTDALFDFVADGKASFGDLVTSILRDFARVKFNEIMADSTKGIFSEMGSFFRGLFTSGGAGQGNAASDALTGVTNSSNQASKAMSDMTNNGIANMAQGIINTVTAQTTEAATMTSVSTTMVQLAAAAMEATFALQMMASQASSSGGGDSGGWVDAAAQLGAAYFAADGGVMSNKGMLPLKKFRNGGVATEPTMAIFAEAGMNEAFVPLPDGRSIPVTVRGDGSQQGSRGQVVPAPVTVNVINQSGTPVQAKTQGQRFDGRQMILDVVLSGMSTPGPFRDSMRTLAGQT